MLIIIISVFQHSCIVCVMKTIGFRRDMSSCACHYCFIPRRNAMNFVRCYLVFCIRAVKKSPLCLSFLFFFLPPFELSEFILPFIDSID